MYTITVCTWTGHIVTVCSIYSNIIYCSSNVHNYCLHLDRSYSNSLFHIQIATPFSLAPVISSFLIDLYQSCPFRRSMPSASPWNKPQNSSSMSKIPVISLSASFCSSKLKLIFSTYILSFLLILLVILATFFAVFVSKLSVRWSLHFVAFGFSFFK